MYWCVCIMLFFFCKQKTAYEMRISDWSSDVCSSDLAQPGDGRPAGRRAGRQGSSRAREGERSCADLGGLCMTILSARRLADVPLFAGLGEAERAEIADGFAPRHFADGEAILTQNERAEGLFLIDGGRVDKIGRAHV